MQFPRFTSKLRCCRDVESPNSKCDDNGDDGVGDEDEDNVDGVDDDDPNKEALTGRACYQCKSPAGRTHDVGMSALSNV